MTSHRRGDDRLPFPITLSACRPTGPISSTVAKPYSDEMSPSSRPFISLNERVAFLRLLLRWQGSIWNLLLVDLVIFLVAYVTISLVYHFLLVHHTVGRAIFEAVVRHAQRVASIVPVTFLLGFFVSTILQRWWIFVHKLPLMSGPAFVMHAYVGSDEQALTRIGFRIRRSLTRYMNLAWILAMIGLSWEVKNRFKPRLTDAELAASPSGLGSRRRHVGLSSTGGGRVVDSLVVRGKEIDEGNTRLDTRYGAGGDKEAGLGAEATAAATAQKTGSLRRYEAGRTERASITGSGASLPLSTPSAIRGCKPPRVSVARCMELINADPQVRRHFGQLITQEEIDVFVKREHMIGIETG
ncbi:unnamed protein product [Protopolystoma xenopodis]|uniref:Bestrophin homolog n=1 Tax=Protopolystoma xenopodis TaxID=117903 RepID=A0A448WIU1_9PLAT|nr:unnamed protein product [Protopolystoma xenopodis]